MQQHIVQKIINSKEELDTKKKLQSFLGLVNQVREYIPNSIITQKPLTYNFNDLKEFKMHIDELLEKQYIQKSNSKHNSPI